MMLAFFRFMKWITQLQIVGLELKRQKSPYDFQLYFIKLTSSKDRMQLVPLMKGRKQYFLSLCYFLILDSTSLALSVAFRLRLNEFFRRITPSAVLKQRHSLLMIRIDFYSELASSSFFSAQTRMAQNTRKNILTPSLRNKMKTLRINYLTKNLLGMGGSHKRSFRRLC